MRHIETDKYKKIIECMPITTVDTVLINPNLDKVLLFLRNNDPAKNNFYTAGGRLHKGEELIDCARRKLKEELGLDLGREEFYYSGAISEYFQTPVSGNIFLHTTLIFILSAYSRQKKFA